MTRVVAFAASALVVLAAGPARAEEPAHEPPKRQIILPEETHGLPPGFHSETRPRYGPIIAGSVMTVMGAAFLGAGLQQKAEADQRAETAPSPQPPDPGGGGEWMTVYGIAHLTVGLPILLYGLLSPREVYVRDPAVSFSLDVRNGQAGSARVKFVF